ncbi:AbfB domain-containing protein [Nonomuraea sp. KM90]|uniref:AbfB domain-containing protein n=1 Tax=Nonomuraea sp. KM90 TaxID=3457428 RepID=UPI003FCC73CD
MNDEERLWTKPLPAAEAEGGWGSPGSNGVSLESVNFPGTYLRHSNCALRLAPDDNTAIFRAGATFDRTSHRW